MLENEAVILFTKFYVIVTFMFPVPLRGSSAPDGALPPRPLDGDFPKKNHRDRKGFGGREESGGFPEVQKASV